MSARSLPPSVCTTRPPFDTSHDWRDNGDGVLRCGYCDASRSLTPSGALLPERKDDVPAREPLSAEREADRRILAAAPANSDDWDEATWAAWFRTADRAHRAPLVVSRFDVAMEPAPEEEQVLTIGAVAEDGRPVALLLDPEARAKVARWLGADRAEVLREAARLLEDTDRDDDAVNLLDNMADAAEGGAS